MTKIPLTHIMLIYDCVASSGSKHGQEVADQLIEISLRVDNVRPFAVESMLSMLLTDSLILGQARQTVSEVIQHSQTLDF